MTSILLTRPAQASARFADGLRATLGDVRIVISPLLRIRWTGTLPEGDLGTPVFTSRNGVEGYLYAGGQPNGTAWCVGQSTADAAGAAGFAPRVGGGDADALVAAILASGERGPFVHIRGRHSRGQIAARLGDAARELVVYDQVAQDLSEEARDLLKRDNPVVVPLFSPRTAVQFARQYRGNAPLYVAAMSTAVEQALEGMDAARTLRAARPTQAAMSAATERLFDAALRLEGGRSAK